MVSLRNFSIPAFLLPVAALAMGCVIQSESAQPKDTGPNYKYPTETSFCSALAAAECNTSVVKACYGAADDATVKTDTDTCVSVRSAQSLCRTIPGYAGDTGNLRYDPAGAEACVENRRQIYADGILDQDELKGNGEACIGVFTKGLGKGATCSFDLDCDTSTSLRCVMKAGDTSGSCAVPTIVEAGKDCSGADAVCTDGNYCDSSVSSCIATKGVGKDCSAAIPCSEGLKCSDPASKGICLDELKNGTDCTQDTECSGGFCEAPTGSTAGSCSSTLTLFKTSASCDDFKP